MVTREVFWGVPTELQAYFYMAAALSTAIFAFGVWSRISVWSRGKNDADFPGFTAIDFIKYAVKGFFSKNCLFARKSFQLATYRGVMLIFIIWGFTTLFIGTSLLTVHHYTIPFLFDSIYYLYSVGLDTAGLLFLIGLLVAILRRHLVTEVRKVTNREDLFFLYLLLFITFTGFTVEGIRLASLRPESMDFSYFGTVFSSLVQMIWTIPAEQYTRIWALHAGSVLFLIAYLPFSKLFHLFSAQVSIAAAEKRYGGAIGGR